MTGQSRHIYEFGPFRLIPEEQQLLRDDTPVSLTPKTFDLLVVLVENSGHLVEKGVLMERIWPDSFVEEANLSVKMSELRRALGEGINEHQYVETVPRRGYRFVAVVKEHWEAGRESSRDESGKVDVDNRALVARDRQALPQSEPDAIHRNVLLRRWPLVLLGSLLLVGLLFGLNVGGLKDSILGRDDLGPIQSIAVLPLENLSGDPSQDYLADGMTDALITDLTKVAALRVTPLPVVMRYKGTSREPSEIGRELNVDAVLTGSVVRAGERVRIAVRMTNTGTARNIWAESYERDLRDVLALQREVTRAIVGEIRIKLTPNEQVQFGTARSVEPEAYDQYLRGRYYLNRQDREGNEAAIAALERAVAADPTFADAQAELAQAYVWRLFLFTPKEGQWAEKAFVAAEKAIALDPNSAVAYLARGRLLWTPANHFPHEKAIREYRRALTLNPNLDEARNQLALVYCHIGAFDEALQESKNAVATNPNNNLAQFRIGQTLNFQGKYQEALDVLRAMPKEANPALVGHQVAWALFNLGRKEEASQTLEQLLKDNPEDSGGLFTSVQAVLAASAGEHQTADDRIRLAIEKGKGFGHFHHTAYHIACAYALMDRPADAVNWLEAAASDGFPCYPLFEKDANLDNIRQDARFGALMSKLRQQWEQYKAI
jgi:TolB-like protein/DNA-binding winged helix-turn-helix (wHTH) protein/Tfp pilus assembly protein PilF